MLDRLFKRRTVTAGDGSPAVPLPSSLTPEDRQIVERALPYTMTGVPRLVATLDAVRYVVSREIPGALAECGVWRGGSVLAMILTLQEAGVENRDLYLYDTFEGMTEPTEHDVSPLDPPALETWQDAERRGERPWSELFGAEDSNEEAVRGPCSRPATQRSASTCPRARSRRRSRRTRPDQLALLRLDTDWYESHPARAAAPLPALLPTGGVLIIDDYGHWEGARRAVDEYFADQPPLLLNRIDYTGRVAIKG